MAQAARAHVLLYRLRRTTGIRASIDWAQVLYQRLRQCQVVVALITPSSLESKWCFGEMVLALDKGKPIFPIKLKPCDLPGLLNGFQSIDLTVDKESGYRRLAAGLKQQGLDPVDVFDLDPARPPYPGFPAFEESDAAVEAQIEASFRAAISTAKKRKLISLAKRAEESYAEYCGRKPRA